MKQKLNLWEQSVICRAYEAGVVDLVSGDSFLSKRRFRKIISNFFRVPRYFQPRVIDDLVSKGLITLNGYGKSMIIISKDSYSLVEEELKEEKVTVQ